MFFVGTVGEKWLVKSSHWKLLLERFTSLESVTEKNHFYIIKPIDPSFQSESKTIFSN